MGQLLDAPFDFIGVGLDFVVCGVFYLPVQRPAAPVLYGSVVNDFDFYVSVVLHGHIDLGGLFVVQFVWELVLFSHVYSIKRGLTREGLAQQHRLDRR